MKACVAVVSDLIFASRIGGTAEKLGTRCTVVRTSPSLQKSLHDNAPDTVFVDMHCEGIAPDEAIRSIKSICPEAHVVAFYSHVQTELIAVANAAGADEVLPRSAFVQRLPNLLAMQSVDRES